MTTFYVGVRPVLAGDNTKNWVHTWKNSVGEYSNWSLMSTSTSPFDGFPDNQYVLGTYKHARLLEYLYSGKQHVAPMDEPGNGTRITGMRYRPQEYKGLAGAAAFPSDFGHAPRRNLYYGHYSNNIFDGVTSADVFAGIGHAQRFSQPYGGPFKPFIYQGVGSSAISDPGSPVPSGYDNAYGKNHVQEWRGVPSARVL
jgi:hypothetical protein